MIPGPMQVARHEKKQPQQVYPVAAAPYELFFLKLLKLPTNQQL